MATQGEAYAVDAKREALSGPRGLKGLVTNPRLLFICFVGVLGGMNYGYEQGACKCDAVECADEKTDNVWSCLRLPRCPDSSVS